MTLQELQKMTVVKLRQEAMQHGISGVSGMSKAELIEALAEFLGIDATTPSRAAQAKISGDKSVLKREIRSLKATRDAALKAGDASNLSRTRLDIKRRKRALRRLAEEAQVATA